jgi:hypothetical protein
MPVLETRVIEADYRVTPSCSTQGTGFLCGFCDHLWFLGYKNRLLRLVAWRPASRELRYGLIRLKIDWDDALQPPLATVISGIILHKAGKSRQFLQFCRIRDTTPYLIRLQRWFVRENARRRAHNLALCMALHPRLGGESPIGALDPDLLRALVLGREKRFIF